MENLISVFTISYRALINLLPYVIVGVIVSELLKFFKWTTLITRLPATAPVVSTALAVVLGILSPLCTYGTIPIVVTLFRLGFTLHPLITFLIASSLMNPQLFLLTWGGISPEFAMVRLVAVLLFSFLFGLAIQKIKQEWIVNPNIQNEEKDFHLKARSFSWPAFFRHSFRALQFVGFYVVIGALLGAFVEVYVPSSWFLVVFQSRQWLGVLIGALLGVPLYACGGGTIPLINSMLANGMSAGAALAFFIVGPATRVTPLMALVTIIRPRFLGLYIAALLLFAIASGILYSKV